MKLQQESSESSYVTELPDFDPESKIHGSYELNKDVGEYRINLVFNNQKECIIGYGERGDTFNSNITISDINEYGNLQMNVE